MNATLKLRLSGTQRRDLELIVGSRRRANAGMKFSDVGREAVEEYIRRHYRR
jgi:hypothetical protein